MFEQPSSENQEQEEAQDLSRVLERLQGTGVFDTDYLASVKLVLYGKQVTRVFEGGQVRPSDRASFGMSDFLMGRRTDFVGIHPRAEFEAQDYGKIPDRKALPFMFVEGRLAFEQMVAHELAHNIFDIRYEYTYGPYTEHDGVTDVSDEYRARMKQQLSALLVQTWPEVDPDRFTWTRQQIAEIFAFLTEREACRRLGVNETMQATVTEKVAQFVKEPEVVLERFNTAQGRQCVLSDMYAENHVLSILLAPVLEQQFPDYADRQALFFEQPPEEKEKIFEVMEVPEVDSRIEWDVQLSSLLFAMEDTQWGNTEHPLMKVVRQYFSEHPIPSELLQDWQMIFDTLGADEESVQNLALAHGHSEREADVLQVIARHKPNIQDVGRLQETLYSILERLDAFVSSSELAEKLRTSLLGDQQARLQKKVETRKMLKALIDFFRPDQKTTAVRRINFIPTDPLRRVNSGWAFQSGGELTVVSHIDNTGNQEHEFLHCVINPIVEKLKAKLTEVQQAQISAMASSALRADYGEGWQSLLCEELIRSYNDVFQHGGAVETYEEFQDKIAGLSEEQFLVGRAEQSVFRKRCDELGIQTVSDFRKKSREFYEGMEKNRLRSAILKMYQDYTGRSDRKMNFERYIIENFTHQL